MTDTTTRCAEANYRGYAGLSPLVGLHSMEEAQKKGLTVKQSAARLLRLHWSLHRLHRVFIARIASMPIYELKMAFSLHAHYCVEHVGDFAKRIREMRQPPYGLESCPDIFLDQFFDEILCAPNTTSLVLGLYSVAIPAVNEALRSVIEETNHLFDHPTYRICRLTLVELEDIEAYGKDAVASVGAELDDEIQAWKASLYTLLDAAGGLAGTSPASGIPVERHFSKLPYKYDGVPKRDERFQDVYNMGVNAEAMLFDPDIGAQPKTLMLYFKRMREIDVPEVISSILAEASDQPWEYYRDMTRQLWDEARHAMMGEVGFISLGIDWRQIPFNITWSLGTATRLSVLDRHAVLFTIEQGLMPKKAGKEYEWEIAVATADRLTELIQDYDWADEILHARIGRDWLLPKFGSMQAILERGNKAWSSILVDWEKWQQDGLTQHRNWWPDIYKNACVTWNIVPDPQLLSYNITYQNTRADMKNVRA
jgi:hypothetical protein